MKKLFSLLLIILLVTVRINAEELGKNSEGYERTKENNYGVTKEIEVNDSNLQNVLRTPYVNEDKKIYDFVDILTDEEEKELKELIDGFIKETQLDFVFVSIDMPYTYDSQNEDYAHDFYDYNNFGKYLDVNGGVILVRNNYASNKYYVAVVKGEAQYYCNESRLDIILDNIYDYFSRDLYKEGIEKFLFYLKNYYDGGYDEEKYYLDENGSLKEKRTLSFLPSILSGGLTSLLVTLGLVKKNKMVKKAKNANEYLDKSSVDYTAKSDTLVSTITTHHRITSDSSGGSSHSSFGSSGRGGISGGRHG